MLTFLIVHADRWFISYNQASTYDVAWREGETEETRERVSVRIDVCKIIHVGAAHETESRRGRERGQINRLKLMTYVSESAFCANIQWFCRIFDMAIFSIAHDIINPTRLQVIIAVSDSAKEGEAVLDRIGERYAIYCVTLHVIIIIVVVIAPPPPSPLFVDFTSFFPTLLPLSAN